MYRLIFTYSYEEKVRKFLKKHPNIKGQYRKTLELLELNPYHPSLRLHQFKTSSFEGYSVSINLSYRISIEFLVTEKEITLINIGDHQEIYGKK
jgi:mRNA-degrading endonuclease YafQ of YafQ-DinJ toxin-antitoxin module